MLVAHCEVPSSRYLMVDCLIYHGMIQSTATGWQVGQHYSHAHPYDHHQCAHPLAHIHFNPHAPSLAHPCAPWHPFPLPPHTHSSASLKYCLTARLVSGLFIPFIICFLKVAFKIRIVTLFTRVIQHFPNFLLPSTAQPLIRWPSSNLSTVEIATSNLSYCQQPPLPAYWPPAGPFWQSVADCCHFVGSQCSPTDLLTTNNP